MLAANPVTSTSPIDAAATPAELKLNLAEPETIKQQHWKLYFAHVFAPFTPNPSISWQLKICPNNQQRTL